MISNEIVVDNFAGGGGASTGIEIAIGRSVDIAINHDPAAIAMHRATHPATEHYAEDVWKVDPKEACKGRPVALAWFSPDCKHHSKAKGGKPVSKKIRGLAWVAVKWAKAVRPRVIMLENVEEFMDWGRLDKNNRPDPRYKGETFRRFVHRLEQLGYKVEWKLLRACDYGAPTIRRRLFLIARCDGRPIIWPEPTHTAPDTLEAAAGLKKPWVPVADVLDFSLPCPSIFASSKEILDEYGIRAVRPLSENTMKRIARGIMKFVVNNPEPFIVSIAQTKFAGDGRQNTVHEPLRTIVSKAEHCLCQPILAPCMMCNNENAAGSSPEEPIDTITTGGHHMLIAPSLVQMGYGEAHGQKPRALDIGKPLGTITAEGNKFGMVSAFISKYYGGENVQASSIEAPLPTIGHFGEVRAFLIKYYGQGGNYASCTDPAPTITAKDRLGLVTVRGQDYRIVDIGLRMLTPRELFDAQGFPADYIIDVDADGKPYPKAEQVARCGNAVCPPVPAALVRANLPELCERKRVSA